MAGALFPQLFRSLWVVGPDWPHHLKGGILREGMGVVEPGGNSGCTGGKWCVGRAKSDMWQSSVCKRGVGGIFLLVPPESFPYFSKNCVLRGWMDKPYFILTTVCHELNHIYCVPGHCPWAWPPCVKENPPPRRLATLPAPSRSVQRKLLPPPSHLSSTI